MAAYIPRGGQLQRIARASYQQEPTIRQSSLAEFLISQFAWGHFSGQLVQKLAELALSNIKAAGVSSVKYQDLENLAKAGSNGLYSNHVHRDIMHQYNSTSQLPSPLPLMIPFARNLGNQNQSILLPHEVFASMYHSYKNAWSSSILPDTNKMREFWESSQNHPNMQANPIAMISNYKEKYIPLALHGDEVPITGKGTCWSKSMLTFQWFSLIPAQLLIRSRIRNTVPDTVKDA